MLLWTREKIVKRCPEGHRMELRSRSCSVCMGGARQAEPVRSDLDQTVHLAKASSSANDGSLFVDRLDLPDPLSPSLRATLRCVPPKSGEDIQILEGSTKLGKSPSIDGTSRLVTLRDEYVSRDHAMIRTEPEGLVIEDLGSTNGTYVNDQRAERAVLKAGDRIRLGRTDFLAVLR